MKKTTTLLATLAICIIAYQTFGQSAGNVIYNNPTATNPQPVNINVNVPSGNQTYLQADVMINVQATSYAAIFSATQNGVTASETDSLMNIRLNMVIDGLKKIGIKDNEIHLDVISFVPTYSLKLEEKKFTKTANEIPTGFQLMKNVHLIFYDHNKLSEIVALMAKAEIYDIVKVDYNIADMQSVYETLRKSATEIVKMKEKDYSKMGLALIVENMSDNFNVAYPLERYASYIAYHTGSSIEEVRLAKKKKEQAKNIYVTGKNPTININTSKSEDDDTEFIVKNTDKNKTIYYNKIPYNQFDLVLNADFVEARIQFFYTVKVRYTVMNEVAFQEMKEMKKEAKEKKEKQENKGWFNKG